jgi:hypothetical protein
MADICDRLPRILRRPVHSTLERLEQAAEQSAHYIRALHTRHPAVEIEAQQILDPAEVAKAELLEDAQEQAEALHQAVMDRLPQVNERFGQQPAQTDYRELIRRRREEGG